MCETTTNPTQVVLKDTLGKKKSHYPPGNYHASHF